MDAYTREYLKRTGYNHSDKAKAYMKKYCPAYFDKTRNGGIRKLVLERDGYKCLDCGMTNAEHLAKWGRSITIDHVDGQGRYSETKNNSLDNQETVCLKCHGRRDRQRYLKSC